MNETAYHQWSAVGFLAVSETEDCWSPEGTVLCFVLGPLSDCLQNFSSLKQAHMGWRTAGGFCAMLTENQEAGCDKDASLCTGAVIF